MKRDSYSDLGGPPSFLGIPWTMIGWVAAPCILIGFGTAIFGVSPFLFPFVTFVSLSILIGAMGGTKLAGPNFNAWLNKRTLIKEKGKARFTHYG